MFLARKLEVMNITIKTHDHMILVKGTHIELSVNE